MCKISKRDVISHRSGDGDKFLHPKRADIYGNSERTPSNRQVRNKLESSLLIATRSATR